MSTFSRISDAFVEAAESLGYYGVRSMSSRVHSITAAVEVQDEKAADFGCGLAHIKKCLEIFKRHEREFDLSTEEKAEALFTFACAWVRRRRTPSAARARELLRALLYDHPESDLPDKVYQSVLVVRGKVTAETKVQRVITRVELQARESEGQERHLH